MKCVNCQSKLLPENNKKKFWEKGDDGLKYRWNKIGEFKEYENECKSCGYKNHFMPL